MTASHSNRWLLLVTVAAGLLLITLDNSVLYTALPTLTRELGATTTQGLWIINAYPLVMAFTLVYTAEHYVIDLLLGWLLAAVVIVALNRFEGRRAKRTAAIQAD